VELDVDKGAASAHYAVLKIPSAWGHVSIIGA
jgi:hypothetical protein